MEINLPEVLRELTEQFEKYEEAVQNYEPEVLAECFWKDPRVLRYGVAENLHGYEEITAYRHARAKAGGAPARQLRHTVITTFGRDFGTANTQYVRTGTGKIGRQSQTWVRLPEGWRIVSAHVSLLQESD
jgi:hypothetical protein